MQICKRVRGFIAYVIICGAFMFDQNKEILSRAEFIAQTGEVNDVLVELRNLCFWDFNLLFLSLPSTEWPALSKLLPRMASDEVQKSWVGASGSQMLMTTVEFVRIMSYHMANISRRSMKELKVLDFGCGFGRLIRALYYFSSPENIYGVDPWDKSIEICRQDGVLGNISQSDYFPTTLPVDRTDFDLIYSYSVFTHTSEAITKKSLSTLRRYISPLGLLFITTRPVEYWDLQSARESRGWNTDEQMMRHRRDGFAFYPSNWNKDPNGESIFGDTSLSPEWIQKSCPEWRVHTYDRGADSFQTILVLTPA
jgi:SAM-dependent methyltransferase